MTSAGSVTVDVQGRDVNLVALLQRVDAQMRQTNQTGLQLAQVASGPVTAAQQRAANAALAEAQALARAAQAVGDDARAHQILVTALGNSTGASDRAVASVTAQIGRLQSGSSAATEFGDALRNGLLGVVGPAALAGAALRALQGAGELIQLGAQAEQTRLRFDALAASANTTGDALLSALRNASAGTISDLNLQLAANRAQLLGVANSAEQFAGLMAIARDRAQQMGISTTQAFNDLVTGLGRGSALILDNLGITVSVTEANNEYARALGKTANQLTEAEQKQALINAVLTQGKASLDATGGALETNASRAERFSAQGENIKAAYGASLVNELGPGIDLLGRIATLATQAGDGARAGATGAQEFQHAFEGASLGAGQFLEIIRNINEDVATVSGFFGTAAAAQDESGQAATRAAAGYDTAAAAALTAGDAAAAATPPTFQLSSAYDAAVAAAQAYQGPGDAFNASLHEHAAASTLASAESQILSAQQQLLFQAAQAAALGMNVGGDAAGNLARQFGITSDEADLLIGRLRQLAQLQNTLAFAKGAAAVGAGGGVGGFLADQAEAAHDKITGVFANLTRGARKYNDDTNRIHRAGGATRLSDQQKLNNQLLTDQERFQTQAEQAEREHTKRLLEIDRDFQKRQLEQQQANEVSKRQSRADFYDSLTSATKDVGGQVAQELSAAYEQAYAQAQAIAQAGNAKLAADYLALKQRQIQDEVEFQKRLAEARKAGDDAEVARLEAIHKLRQDANAEEEKKLLEGGDANVNQRNEALTDEQRRFEEQQGKIADSADAAAERKINAAVRSGKAIDDENIKLREQEQILARIGSRGGPAAGSEAPAASGAPAATPTGTPAPGGLDLSGLAERLQAIVDAINTQGGTVATAATAAGDKVARAVAQRAVNQ